MDFVRATLWALVALVQHSSIVASLLDAGMAAVVSLKDQIAALKANWQGFLVGVALVFAAFKGFIEFLKVFDDADRLSRRFRRLWRFLFGKRDAEAPAQDAVKAKTVVAELPEPPPETDPPPSGSPARMPIPREIPFTDAQGKPAFLRVYEGGKSKVRDLIDAIFGRDRERAPVLAVNVSDAGGYSNRLALTSFEQSLRCMDDLFRSYARRAAAGRIVVSSGWRSAFETTGRNRVLGGGGKGNLVCDNAGKVLTLDGAAAPGMHGVTIALIMLGKVRRLAERAAIQRARAARRWHSDVEAAGSNRLHVGIDKVGVIYKDKAKIIDGAEALNMTAFGVKHCGSHQRGIGTVEAVVRRLGDHGADLIMVVIIAINEMLRRVSAEVMALIEALYVKDQRGGRHALCPAPAL